MESLVRTSGASVMAIFPMFEPRRGEFRKNNGAAVMFSDDVTEDAQELSRSDA